MGVLTLGWLATCPGLAVAAESTRPKIFVSATGNDANTGDRLSPKRNFQAAHDAVAAGGQIVVLDTAGYGTLTITKSVSITVPPGVNAFVTATGNASGITINAGAADEVSLRGLIVEGSGTAYNNGNGIAGNSVGTLRVEDCTVRNFFIGITLRGSAAYTPYLLVRGGSAHNVGYGVYPYGVAHGTLEGVVSGFTVDGATNSAIAADGDFDATSTVRVVATHCVAFHSDQGFSAYDGATMYVDACTSTGNKSGVYASTNGKVISRGNNTLADNLYSSSFSSYLNAQ